MDYITFAISANTGNILIKQIEETKFPGSNVPNKHVHMRIEIDPQTNAIVHYKGFSANGRPIELRP